MEQENSLIPEEEIKKPEISENDATTETVPPVEETTAEVVKEKQEIPEVDFLRLVQMRSFVRPKNW